MALKAAVNVQGVIVVSGISNQTVPVIPTVGNGFSPVTVQVFSGVKSPIASLIMKNTGKGASEKNNLAGKIAESEKSFTCFPSHFCAATISHNNYRQRNC